MLKRLWLSFSLLFMCTACDVPPYDTIAHKNQAKTAPFYKDVSVKASFHTITGAVAGQNCHQSVLFIHGAPGNWSAWGPYLADPDLNQRSFLMSFDRPGYGGSEKGNWEGDLSKQSQDLIDAASQFHNGPFIVVGHSFGGPLALQMAIDHPDKVAALVILAGSVDPDLEKTKWFQYVADSFLFRWMVPSALNVANQEILVLKSELVRQRDKLKQIKAPTTIIQGGRDTLVPPANADYAHRHLINAPVKVIHLPDQNHFLPWNEYELVKSRILSHLGKQQSDCP